MTSNKAQLCFVMKAIHAFSVAKNTQELNYPSIHFLLLIQIGVMDGLEPIPDVLGTQTWYTLDRLPIYCSLLIQLIKTQHFIRTSIELKNIVKKNMTYKNMQRLQFLFTFHFSFPLLCGTCKSKENRSIKILQIRCFHRQYIASFSVVLGVNVSVDLLKCADQCGSV